MKGCRALTDDEIRAILEKIAKNRYPLRDRALFLLGCRSGFRISELLSLTVGDVWQNGNLTDRIEVKRRNMKKKREGRIVPIHPEAREALRWLILETSQKGETAPSQPLFLSREGGGKSLDRRSAWSMLKKTYAACGLTGKIGTHGMRKTFAKKVHAHFKQDLIKTQKALGHASVNSTVSYLSFDDADIDDAILKS